jgi:photosystem II stability/assembly factor-like uncharacterized protein
MRKHFPTLAVFSLLFAGCTAPTGSAAAVITPTHSVVSLLPAADATAPAVSSISTPAPVSTAEGIAGELVHLTSIHMYSETGGWAQANVPDGGIILLHTVDGGQSWQEVNPKTVASGSFGASFLDESTAWVYSTDPSGNNASLLRTLDGGSTWEMINQSLPPSFLYLASGMTFLNSEEGWTEVYDVGAGQAHIQIYSTQDGGESWSQVMLGSPENDAGEPPGTLHLCNICGDSFYYDPLRQFITYGDLASDPAGKVRASISFDYGKTWKNLALPFPSAKFADALVVPQVPVFFNKREGMLPVGLVKLNADGAHAYDVLAIYTTSTGGVSWAPNPVFLENVNSLILNHSTIDFVSYQDAFVPCGSDLCVTNDGTQTWQTLHTDLNFTYSDTSPQYVEQFDFISPVTGWAISTNGNTSSLWKTEDEGHTWEKINPLLITK